METTKFIWMDGKLIPWDQATIHILTHSLHYGSAVFEGIRFYETDKGPAVFRLDEHLDRLYFSAESMYMKIPFSKEELRQAVLSTVRATGVKSGYIRPIVFYGYGKMGLGTAGASVNVAIAAWPWGAYLGEHPVKVKTSSFIRLHPKSAVMGAKISGYYFNSILASEEAKRAGVDEALLLDYRGRIAEGPGENFFIVKKGKIITPKLGGILPGITRASIIQIAKDCGVSVEERDLKLKQAYAADEAFFTGSAAEVTPIASIDSHELKNAPGALTEKIKEIYMRAVAGKEERYDSWISVV
jgi:branched-chain amino acid aminotransferase